jgi:hypothetical protein
MYFGDSLLFICYEFLHEMHVRPKDFDELFEFLRYGRAKNVLTDMAIAAAKVSNG